MTGIKLEHLGRGIFEIRFPSGYVETLNEMQVEKIRSQAVFSLMDYDLEKEVSNEKA